MSKNVQSVQRGRMLFDEVILLDLRLIDLICEGNRLAQSGLTELEKERYWYKIMKPQMMEMVGYNAVYDELSPSYYYDMMYNFFNKLLAI